MEINDLRIKSKIVKTTHLSKGKLMARVSHILEKDGYNTKDISDSEIEFEPIKDGFSKLRGTASQRIYQGAFLMVEEGEYVQLELTYFIPYKFFYS